MNADELRISLDGSSAAAIYGMRLDWLDAHGAILTSSVLPHFTDSLSVLYSSGTAAAQSTGPLAGAASLRATDPLSGCVATMPLR